MCWTCGRACQAEKEDHDKDLSAAVKATKRPDMKVESRTRAARPAARGGPRRSAGAPLPSPPDARSRRATSHTQMQDGARGRSARTARSDKLASRATSVLFSPRASLAAPREPHRPRRDLGLVGAHEVALARVAMHSRVRDAVLVPRLVAAGLVDPLAILLLHEASMPHEGLPSREGGVLPPVLHRSLVGSVVVVLAVLLRGLQRALGARARHACHLPSAVFGVCLRSVPLAPPLSNINYIYRASVFRALHFHIPTQYAGFLVALYQGRGKGSAVCYSVLTKLIGNKFQLKVFLPVCSVHYLYGALNK